jgi:CRP-like cAMP-binding protein
MIEKMLPELELLRFDEGEIIFHGGDFADCFYMLKRGKILLEQRISEKVTVSVGAVKAGFSFGWSAMLGRGVYSLDTVCGEPCETLRIKGKTLLNLFEQDHTMGYRLMRLILKVMKKRLDYRTEQFIKVIRDHPDIQPLIDSD